MSADRAGASARSLRAASQSDWRALLARGLTVLALTALAASIVGCATAPVHEPPPVANVVIAVASDRPALATAALTPPPPPIVVPAAAAIQAMATPPATAVAATPAAQARPGGGSTAARPRDSRFASSASAEQAGELIRGSVLVTAPSNVRQRDTFTATLDVAASKLAPLVASVRTSLAANDQRLGQEGVDLSPQMSATLQGIGFDIVPPEAKVQTIDLTGTTGWTWQVRASDPGHYKLTFVLTGSMKTNGLDAPKEFYSHVQDIEVGVVPAAASAAVAASPAGTTTGANAGSGVVVAGLKDWVTLIGSVLAALATALGLVVGVRKLMAPETPPASPAVPDPDTA